MPSFLIVALEQAMWFCTPITNGPISDSLSITSGCRCLINNTKVLVKPVKSKGNGLRTTDKIMLKKKGVFYVLLCWSSLACLRKDASDHTSSSFENVVTHESSAWSEKFNLLIFSELERGKEIAFFQELECEKVNQEFKDLRRVTPSAGAL